MEIPPPDRRSPEQDPSTELSLYDACFHLQSQFLIPSVQGQKPRREYESSYDNNFAVVAEG
jgi:predicted DNA-binding ArsR family transcriptional regulator